MSAPVVLLQTDLVESTQLAAQLGDSAMAHVWDAHDRIARDLLVRWNGRELDKTDGFLFRFKSVEEAIGYAADYHQALGELSPPLSARAGLHLGAIVFRENSPKHVSFGARPVDERGLAIAVTARVASVALPGQTLLTAEARQALRETTLRVESHGYWRMKGLAEPVELFQAGGGDAPFVPPPDSPKVYRVARSKGMWLPVREVRHSLPAERDAFVGRVATLESLAERLDGPARLVTILGSGGAGKTRVAQHFGWTWLGDYPGGVWFCDLSQARSQDGIVQSVAAGLGVQADTKDPFAQISRAITGRGHCLVILDNFEQVTGYARETLGMWLDHAADARFLVTSREALNLVGEEILILETLSAREGEALFLRRALAADSNFRPTDSDRAAIAPLVKLLDGLPLAIELAAARIRVLSPAALLERMRKRFEILVSSHGRPDRQATLRATIDWSWDLLSQAERIGLAQISVFEGGFTLAAAEAILDLSEVPGAPPCVDLIQSLVDKSLVRRLGERFGQLSMVQEYAAERLRGVEPIGPLRVRERAAKARHWLYYAAMPRGKLGAARDTDLENLVAACQRASDHEDAGSAVACLDAAWDVIKLIGPFRRVLEVAVLVRETRGLTPEKAAIIDWVCGSAKAMLGQERESIEEFEHGLAMAQGADDRTIEARLLCGLGDQLSLVNRSDEARNSLERALALAQTLQDVGLQCKALNGLGALANDLGQFDKARVHYRAALELAHRAGDRRWQGGLVGNLGVLHHLQGELDHARENYESALDFARESGDRRWEGNARSNLGLLHHEQGREDDAQAELYSALKIARAMGYARLEGTLLCNLGIVFEARGNLDAAAASLEAAVAIAEALQDYNAQGHYRSYLGTVCARLDRVEEGLRCIAQGESRLADGSDHQARAFLQCARAEIYARAGNGPRATREMKQAELLVAEAHPGPASELARRFAAAQRLLE